MKLKVLALVLCMFCGMSFLTANDTIETKAEVAKEVAADETEDESEEIATGEQVNKKIAQEEKKSCCGCTK